MLSETISPDSEKPEAFMDFDGYRVEFPKWWFNIRPSNTEPYLRSSARPTPTSCLRRRCRPCANCCPKGSGLRWNELHRAEVQRPAVIELHWPAFRIRSGEHDIIPVFGFRYCHCAPALRRCPVRCHHRNRTQRSQAHRHLAYMYLP